MRNPEIIKNIFNNLAKRYDFYNRVISLGTQTRVKKNSLKQLKLNDGDKVLDVCTGTGDLVYYMDKLNPNLDLTGVDFSEKMLEIAREKQGDKKNIRFFIADGRELPFEDNSFDVVTIGFGLRNIKNYERVVDEIKRVLKNRGQVLNIDFSCDDTVGNSVFDLIVKIFTGLTSRKNSYRYLIESKKEFLNTTELINLFRKKGFIFLRRKYYMFEVIASELFRNNK